MNKFRWPFSPHIQTQKPLNLVIVYCVPPRVSFSSFLTPNIYILPCSIYTMVKSLELSPSQPSDRVRTIAVFGGLLFLGIFGYFFAKWLDDNPWAFLANTGETAVGLLTAHLLSSMYDLHLNMMYLYLLLLTFSLFIVHATNECMRNGSGGVKRRRKGPNTRIAE